MSACPDLLCKMKIEISILVLHVTLANLVTFKIT